MYEYEGSRRLKAMDLPYKDTVVNKDDLSLSIEYRVYRDSNPLVGYDERRGYIEATICVEGLGVLNGIRGWSDVTLHLDAPFNDSCVDDAIDDAIDRYVDDAYEDFIDNLAIRAAQLARYA